MEANFSLINFDQSNVSRKFTAWAAIIAVPTMIAGFYGMNFQFMPELQWQYGYVPPPRGDFMTYTEMTFTYKQLMFTYKAQK